MKKITEDGSDMGEFNLESEWNGLDCLVNVDGEAIIVRLGVCVEIGDPDRQQVLTASPSLLQKITEKK